MTFSSINYQTQQKRLIEQIEAQIAQGSFGATVVEKQTDYESDPARCLASVCRLPMELADYVERAVIAPLRTIQPCHYYYCAEQIHLTIKNIRVIHDPPRFNDNDVRSVEELFANIVPKHSPFDFKLQGSVLFPTSLAIIGYSDRSFGDLIHDLDQGLRRIGLPDDKHYASDSIFFGNVTVCRLTDTPSQGFLEQVRAFREREFGQFTVKCIDLVSCNAVYTSRRIWRRFPLKVR